MQHARFAAIVLCALPLAACQEERINPLPAAAPVDMAWLQAQLTEHTGAPAEPDAIAPVLKAVADMRAIADEVRPRHEALIDNDLPSLPDMGWLMPGSEELDPPEGLLAYAEETFALMDERGVWAALDEAAAAEGLNVAQFGSYEEFKEHVKLGDLRRLVRAAELRCHRAAAARDSAVVAESLGHILAIARVASTTSTSIGFLVSANAQSKAEEGARRYSEVLMADREQVERLAVLLDRHGRLVPVEVAFELEHRFGRRGLELLYAPAPLKRSDPPDAVRVKPVEGSAVLAFVADEDESPEALAPLADILVAMDRLDQSFLDAIALPRSQRSGAMNKLLALEDSLDDSVWPVNTWVGAHARLIDEHDEQRTRLTLLGAMLAVELFRLDHNWVPVSLEELVPEYLPAVPPDPLGQGPLRYRLVEDGESLPGDPSYLLYSVGVDGEDNGGVIPRFDHDAFTDRERTRGCDYIVNVPPERE